LSVADGQGPVFVRIFLLIRGDELVPPYFPHCSQHRGISDTSVAYLLVYHAVSLLFMFILLKKTKNEKHQNGKRRPHISAFGS
jgi:hypothetical protein